MSEISALSGKHKGGLFKLLIQFVFRYADLFTMDVIASTAFGLKIDSQKDKNNQFVQMAKKIFDFSIFNPIVIVACKCADILLPFLSKLN